MQIDSGTVKRGTTLDFDACVVGAGAAGITLARELAGSRLRVCILESGGFEPDARTQGLYQGVIVGGLAHAPLESFRQRYFGGSTNCWGGGCLPYDPIDFEVRDGIPMSGWPIPYDSLGPYYRRASAYVNIGKNVFDRSMLADPRRPEVIDGIGGTGDFVTKYLRRGKPTARFGTQYRDDVCAPQNITLFTKANATELQMDGAGSRVSRVEVKTLAGNRFFVRARCFVLAMGGLETPRLLLASNRVQPRGVGNAGGMVGRCYSPHVNSAHGIVVLRKGVGAPSGYERNIKGVKHRRFLSLSDSTMRREKLLNCKMTLEPVDRIRENPLTESVFRVINDRGARDKNAVGFLSSGERPGFERFSKGSVFSIDTAFEQVPNPDSRVRLSSNRDELGMPLLTMEHRVTDQDVRSYMRTYELLALTLGRLGLGRFCSAVSGREVLDGGEGRSHHTGTTRMATSPSRGVVDTECRVFGVDNLYVSSAAVFPTPSHANPTFTIIAMAIRLADHVRSQYRG